MGKTLDNALVGILQVILAHKSDLQHLRRLFATLEEIVPWAQVGSDARLQTHLLQYHGIQSLPLHVHGHLVNAGQVLALNDRLHLDIAEMCHFCTEFVTQRMLCTEHQDLWLDAKTLQLLHAHLGGLRLQLTCCCQKRHVGKVYIQCARRTQLPPELADGLQERLTLNVADSASYLGNDKVKGLLCGIEENAPLDFIRDVRHYLDGLSQIVAAPLTLDDTQVDTTCCHTVVAGRLYAGKPFVMSQVEIGLHAIGSDVALPMLIGVQRTRVDVDIRVEFLNGDAVSSRLQQFSQ